jgi:hypothetical protein
MAGTLRLRHGVPAAMQQQQQHVWQQNMPLYARGQQSRTERCCLTSQLLTSMHQFLVAITDSAKLVSADVYLCLVCMLYQLHSAHQL